MRTRPTLSVLVALGMFGLSALAVRSAAAREAACDVDAECAKGFTCEVVGGEGCAYACAPGVDCGPPPECATEVREIKACRPGPCTADADCADGMLCFTTTASDCPPSACTAGEECETPACEAKTTSQCVPRYQLPCKVAADCGDGFNCVETQQDCACSSPSSGGGSDSSGGGAPAPAPSPTPQDDCKCEPSTVSVCYPKQVGCDTAADCADGWSCNMVGATADCNTSAPSDPDAPDAPKAGPAPCAPSAIIQQCYPPYYSGGIVPTGAPISDSGPANETGSGADPSRASDSADSSSAGCSVALGARSGGAGAVLFALGLLGMVRRRRNAVSAR